MGESREEIRQRQERRQGERRAHYVEPMKPGDPPRLALDQPKVHPLLNRRRKERRAVCGDRAYRTEGGWTGPCDKMKGHEPPHHYTGV